MENKKNESRNVELKRAFSVLEGIVNECGLETAERLISEYRVFAYANENYDKEIGDKVERAFQKYAKNCRYNVAYSAGRSAAESSNYSSQNVHGCT